MDSLLKGIKVKESYFFKIGSLPINQINELNKYSENKKEQIDDFPEELDQQFKEELERIFAEHPNITNYEQVEIERIKRMGYHSKDNEFFVKVFSNAPYNLSFSVPKTKQEVYLHHCDYFGNTGVEVSENFDMLYDGSIFIYYRKCDLSFTEQSGGSDARDELDKILSSKFEIISNAPNPLRQDFFIIITGSKIKSNIIYEDNRIYFIFKDKIDVKKFLAEFLYMEEFFLNHFYITAHSANDLDDLNYHFSRKYSEIFKLLSKLDKTVSFNILEKNELIKKIKNEFSRLYQIIGRYTQKEEELRQEIRSFNQVNKYTILEPLKKELKRDFEYTQLHSDTLLQNLQVIRYNIEDFQKTRQMVITIIFSIISAILGAIIYGYFLI